MSVILVLVFTLSNLLRAEEKATHAPAVSAQPPQGGAMGLGSWKKFVDEKKIFQFEYPTKWKVEFPKIEGPNPVLISIGKPDSTVLVTLMKTKGEAKGKAVEFLNQMDQSRKAVNQIAEAQRTLSAEVASKMKAEEVAVGVYEIKAKVPVMQRVLALKKAKEIYVITASYQKSRELEDEPLVEKILTGFEFLEEKK